MPTPSQSFREAYSATIPKPSISLPTANKRYLRLASMNSDLTLAEFFADMANLDNERRRNMVKIGGTESTVAAVAEQAKRSRLWDGLSQAGILYNLNRYLKDQGCTRTFATISELISDAKNRTNFGQANPIRIGVNFFQNVESFRNHFASRTALKSRTLADRVYSLKQDQGLEQTQTLNLSEEGLTSLLANQEKQLPYLDFESRIQSYLSTHGLRLISGPSVAEGGDHTYLSIENAYARYENNTTKFDFECIVCKEHRPDKRFFQKSLSKFAQGCPTCAEVSRRDQRRTPASEVRSRIRDELSSIEWTGPDVEYVNRRSVLTLSCKKCGHCFKRSSDDALRDGRSAKCPACGPKYLGETLSLVIANYVLGTGRNPLQFSQKSPNHLSSWKGKGILRHDGFWPRETIADDFPYHVALEHQGAQHNDESHHLHGKNNKERNKKFKALQERDAFKVEACKTYGLKLVLIPDLLKNYSNLPQATKCVADCLTATVGNELSKLKGFQERLRSLQDEHLLFKLLDEVAPLDKVLRLKEQLLQEESGIEIIRYDPVSDRFTLHCPVHADRGTWNPMANNAFSSEVTGRRGTRCKHCASRTFANSRRKSWEEVCDGAEAFGFRPDFEYSEYKNNSTRLRWICMQDPTHAFEDTFSHLDRGCRHCRKEKQNLARRSREFAKIKEIDAENGDELVSDLS